MPGNTPQGEAPPNPLRSGFLGAVSQQPGRFTPDNARRALLDLVPTDRDTLELHGVTGWPSFFAYMLQRIAHRINYHYGLNATLNHTIQHYIDAIEEQP